MQDDQAAAIRQDVQFVGDTAVIGELFLALAAAQAEFLPLGKEASADVKNKEGKFLYSFDYCPLDGVIAATRPALTRHKLALIQLTNGNELVTILAHGPARIESRCFLSPWETPQQFGGVLTYFKRYAMLSLLAVFPAGEDDDANQAQGNQAAITKRQPPAAPKAQAPTADAAKDDTKRRIIQLSKETGHASLAELEEFSVKAGCGPLKGQTEIHALRLVVALEALRAKEPS